MACAAKWTACWLDPHIRLRLTAGTVTGKTAGLAIREVSGQQDANGVIDESNREPIDLKRAGNECGGAVAHDARPRTDEPRNQRVEQPRRRPKPAEQIKNDQCNNQPSHL